MQTISFPWFSPRFYMNLTNGFSSKISQKTRVLSEGLKKSIIPRIGVSWTHNLLFCFSAIFLTQLIMVILSKGCEPDNFEPHNSLKLSFTNIWGLPSNFIECESFLGSNSPDILALCETNLDDSIESLSSFNLKRFYYSYAWSCSFCERRTSFWTRLSSRKLCGFLLMFSTDFTSFSILLLFPLSITFIVMQIFDSISSNTDEVLSINPSANVFVFEAFNVHLKDWLTYSHETDRLVNSVIIFLFQTTLLRQLTSLLRSLTVTLTVLLF